MCCTDQVVVSMESSPSSTTNTIHKAPVIKKRAPLVHRNEHQIRQRLLHRLGIPAVVSHSCDPSAALLTKAKHESVQTYYKRNRPSGSGSPDAANDDNNSNNNNTNNSSRKTCKNNALYDSYESPIVAYDDVSSSNNQIPTPNNTTTTTMNTKGHTVRFASMARIQEIPSHRDYNPDQRQRIWMGTTEIHENSHRSRMEYVADGCDYQKVTEESGMMPWKGELVHPVTYWTLYEEEQRQQVCEDRKRQQEDFRRMMPKATKSSSSFFSTTSMPLMSGSMKRSSTVTSLAGLAL